MIINLREYKSLGFLTYHKPSRALYITTTSGIVRMNVSANAPSGRYVNATTLDLKKIGTQMWRVETAEDMTSYCYYLTTLSYQIASRKGKLANHFSSKSHRLL